MPRREIDPQLPYIQLHRSAVQKCATLAAMNGLHQAHALGAMSLFWTDLSDRRRLLKWLRSPEQACVLTAEELVGKLRMAFGKEIPLADLVLVGFLEPMPTPHHYRVRGMSRQLATEAKRLRIPFEEQLRSPSAPPEVAPGSIEVRGERREVRDEAKEEALSSPKIEQAFLEVPLERRSPPLRALSDRLVADYLELRREKYDFQSGRDGPALAHLAKAYPHELIRDRWRKGLESDHPWKRISTLGQLRSKWNDLADDAPPPQRPGAPPPPKPLTRYNGDEDPYATPVKPPKKASG